VKMVRTKTNIHLKVMVITTLLITTLVIIMKLPRELLLLTVGIVMSMLLYEKYRYRVGGILALTLLVLYGFSSLKIAFWLFLIVIINWLVLEGVFKKTIVYGRRLFFMSCLISIALTFMLYLIIDQMPVYITVIPGIIAYNLHYEKNANGNLSKSIKLLLLHILVLVIVGVILGVS